MGENLTNKCRFPPETQQQAEFCIHMYIKRPASLCFERSGWWGEGAGGCFHSDYELFDSMCANKYYLTGEEHFVRNVKYYRHQLLMKAHTKPCIVLLIDVSSLSCRVPFC